MGLLIGIGKTSTPTTPGDGNSFYGVEWDTALPNPELVRIGEMGLHASLPIQSGMARCLLLDDGTVNYYLHPTDSTKKADGTAAVLDGTDGQVMVEIPAHYRKFEMDGTVNRCYISQYPLVGYHLVPKTYRSAYEAYNNGGKLSSVSGVMPSASISLTNFRAYARARGTAGMNGAGWNCDVYDIQKTTYWLYLVEYANFNCQAAYNAEPTAEGYKQGGLGDGVTNASAYVQTGATNSLGNQTGVVTITSPATGVPSYRGIENPFGNFNSWTDGVKVRVQSASAGGKSEMFVCTDPLKFNDSGYSDYENRGQIARVSGQYITALVVGEYGENLPSAASGGSATTYMCDYFYTSIPSSGEAERGVFFGGYRTYGASAGFVFSNTYSTASATSTPVGSRLCFIPA